MTSVWFFIKTTIKGGIFFFLPIVFLIITIQQAIAIFSAIISPLAARLGLQHFAGKATLTILVIFAILLVCFLGGMLMRIRQLKKINDQIEKIILAIAPNYKRFKSNQQEK